MRLEYPRRFDYDTEEQFHEACEAYEKAETEYEDASVELHYERLYEK